MKALDRLLINDHEKIAQKFKTKEKCLGDKIIAAIYGDAQHIANQVIKQGEKKADWDSIIDDIVTSKVLGFLIMGLVLCVVLWLTITGANYPSELLAKILLWGQNGLETFLKWVNSPVWLQDFIVNGFYRCIAWVISVMLPPMAIFFPLFTLLEDFGYLPRVAFNLDNTLRKVGCHGKQALTMCMGVGCNAAGVISCRIIDSPRERLIAILTNNFVPCNGRFPILIIMAAVLGGAIIAPFNNILAAVIVAAMIILGIIVTLIMSYVLSQTILKGIPSSFSLELPPYRKPLVGQVIIRSIFDRTIFVLGRAIVVAAPAGVIIWIMANISIGGTSIFAHCSGFLDPFGRLIGLDGIILMAFILGLPANEIVLPIMIMGYLNSGTMIEISGIQALKEVLVYQNGWTWLTVLCIMLFSLLHYPCGTTLFTIYKETKSPKWTLISFIMPLCVACIVCLLIAGLARASGMV